jgi:hypothetical protein
MLGVVLVICVALKLIFTRKVFDGDDYCTICSGKAPCECYESLKRMAG